MSAITPSRFTVRTSLETISVVSGIIKFTGYVILMRTITWLRCRRQGDIAPTSAYGKTTGIATQVVRSVCFKREWTWGESTDNKNSWLRYWNYDLVYLLGHIVLILMMLLQSAACLKYVFFQSNLLSSIQSLKLVAHFHDKLTFSVKSDAGMFDFLELIFRGLCHLNFPFME